MAIQMARAYTGNYDVIIFEESFHGGLSTGADMSAKVLILIYLHLCYKFILLKYIIAGIVQKPYFLSNYNITISIETGVSIINEELMLFAEYIFRTISLAYYKSNQDMQTCYLYI